MASVSARSTQEDAAAVLKELSTVFDACIARHIATSGQTVRAVTAESVCRTSCLLNFLPQELEADLHRAKDAIFSTTLQAFCGSEAVVDPAVTESELREALSTKLPGTETILSCVTGSDAEKREQV
jgi:hypothetical protein